MASDATYCSVPDKTNPRTRCVLAPGHEGDHRNGLRDGRPYTWPGGCLCRDDQGVYREPCPYGAPSRRTCIEANDNKSADDGGEVTDGN